MIRKRAIAARIAPLLALILAACVSEQKYDALEQKYETMQRQLSSEISADQVTITKLQGELKVTMRDEILFPEGGWQLNLQAKSTLNKIVPSLNSLQQTRIVVDGYTDNVPIGPELQRMGILVQPGAVLTASRQRCDVPAVARGEPEPDVGAGLRRYQSRRLERHAGGPGEESSDRTDPRRSGHLSMTTTPPA